MKICVYCASSAAIDTTCFDATERLSREFLREDVLPAVKNAAVWDKDAIDFAVNRG